MLLAKYRYGAFRGYRLPVTWRASDLREAGLAMTTGGAKGRCGKGVSYPGRPGIRDPLGYRLRRSRLPPPWLISCERKELNTTAGVRQGERRIPERDSRG